VSVDFDPVKLGPRRRRIDPVRVLILTVAAALAVAIVKPWAPSPTTDGPGPSVAAAPPSVPPSGSPTPGPTARTTRTAVSTGVPAPTWAEVAPIITAHDTLGVRAILVARRPNVGNPANPRFQEHWSRTTPDLAGVATAYVTRDEQSIVALGITFPTDAAPLDVRIWRLHANDQFEWIDARPLEPTDPIGAFTFAKVGPSGSDSESWPSGHYRIDILAEDAVHRIALQIPGRFGSVPAPDEWPQTLVNLVGPEESDPSAVRVGPFATVDGVAVPLATRTGALMTEEEEWRRVHAEDQAGLGASVVASAHLPRATGLGVMLTSHAGVRLAIVRRIAPDARFSAAPMLGGISESQGRTPWVAFAPRGGGMWPPGVYAITVRWTDPGGLHVETWHVELRPGPGADSVLAR
jgi:hypothetical protein